MVEKVLMPKTPRTLRMGNGEKEQMLISFGFIKLDAHDKCTHSEKVC